MDPDYTFDPVKCDPAASIDVELDLFGKCAILWQPNEHYDVGDTIRPSRPDGLAIECTQAGTSGAREPVWNRVADQPLAVLDGSAGWIRRAAEGRGVAAMAALSFTSDPAGLVATDVSINEDTKILATYSAPGAVDGQQFDAVFSFTIGGVPRVARQPVKVRKR